MQNQLGQPAYQMHNEKDPLFSSHGNLRPHVGHSFNVSMS